VIETVRRSVHSTAVAAESLCFVVSRHVAAGCFAAVVSEPIAVAIAIVLRVPCSPIAGEIGIAPRSWSSTAATVAFERTPDAIGIVRRSEYSASELPVVAHFAAEHFVAAVVSDLTVAVIETVLRALCLQIECVIVIAPL
jgi:hypothetical protein